MSWINPNIPSTNGDNQIRHKFLYNGCVECNVFFCIYIGYMYSNTYATLGSDHRDFLTREKYLRGDNPWGICCSYLARRGLSVAEAFGAIR